MSFLSKLFGKKTTVSTSTRRPPAKKPTSAANSTDAELITIYDAYGREMQITKREWRTKVLPGNLKAQWQNPDHLYEIIVNALGDGFLQEVIDAARHLYQIDHNPMRAACIWGIVLMKDGQLNEAEQVLNTYTKKHGESGVILTNLAKIYDERKETDKTAATLWHALELDPNLDNAVAWYMARAHEAGGVTGQQAALKRLAELPKSWRAQVWLARTALEAQQREVALNLYRTAIAHVGYPPPSDLLMQISGDLGNNGHLHDILQLVEPHFAPDVHGLQVGNNLLKAAIDLNKYDVAQRVLDQLYAQKRPDWKQHLSYWDTELAKKKVEAAPFDPQQELQLTMLTLDGPVWLKPDAPAATLFPTPLASAPHIAFIGCTAADETGEQTAVRQLADARGRMSRAEQVALTTQAFAHTLVPWIIKPSPGFLLSGSVFADDDAAHHARSGSTPSDYVVITHLVAKGDAWTLSLRIVRTIDASCLKSLSATCTMNDPMSAVQTLAQQTIAELTRIAKVPLQDSSPRYQVPSKDNFVTYLLRIEQLLAVRCSGMDGVPGRFLNGEREIIDGNLQLCLAYPESVNVRLLLMQTVLAMKRVRPEVVAEFAEKVVLLQKEHPLSDSAQGLAQRLVNEMLKT